tara:strand:+ start:868 stop:1737 length:870 start_codon:yes stop_codon:yes gene_type:complete
MKGIILAGGSGTRLYPSTISVSKQLLSIYDKPMIYYPLSVLMLGEIKDILIISTPKDISNYKLLLGDGSRFGIKLSYEIQKKPMGLAQAFIIGESFISNDDVCLILGDNLFYGSGFTNLIKESINEVIKNNKSIIFSYSVKNPSQFGIVEFDEENNVLSLEEKPKKPKSNFAIVGLYFYPNDVILKSKSIKISKRGEYEITSINNSYLKENRIKVKLMGRGYSWLDTGTHDSLLEASNFVKNIQQNTGFKIACLEEIALRNGFISKETLRKNIKKLNSDYYDYLNRLIK